MTDTDVHFIEMPTVAPRDDETKEYEAMVASQIAEGIANYTDEQREVAAFYRGLGW
jgi:hypothetical protein